MLTITAIAFVSLTAVIWVFGTVTLDQQAFETIIELATPGVVRVMKVVNYAGEKLVLIPAMVVLYVVFRRARRQWWIWAALMVAARIAERLVKLAVGRARPMGEGFAFPSAVTSPRPPRTSGPCSTWPGRCHRPRCESPFGPPRWRRSFWWRWRESSCVLTGRPIRWQERRWVWRWASSAALAASAQVRAVEG